MPAKRHCAATTAAIAREVAPFLLALAFVIALTTARPRATHLLDHAEPAVVLHAPSDRLDIPAPEPPPEFK